MLLASSHGHEAGHNKTANRTTADSVRDLFSRSAMSGVDYEAQSAASFMGPRVQHVTPKAGGRAFSEQGGDG